MAVRSRSVIGGLYDLVRGGVAVASTTLPWPSLGSDPTDFYLPPSPLGDGAPGELIRAQPMTAFLVPGVRLRARAWRILYRSTSPTGTPTAVSGVVLVPHGSYDGLRPIVGYAPGTHGMGDQAAPSRQLGRGIDYEATLVATVLARGYAVALTDYQGLGTPGDHPYVVGRALGANVLDAIRAARSLTPAALPPAGPLGVIGYSEGGAGAGWAAELAATYAPELALAGVVAGAVPADLNAVSDFHEGTLVSFFAGYGAIGFAAGYPELELEAYLTPRGRELLERFRHSTVIGAAVLGPHNVSVSEIMTTDVRKLPEWQERLRMNSLGSTAPSVPVLLHTPRLDPIVPTELTHTLYRQWKALGAEVSLLVTPGVEHLTGALVGTPPALDWLGRKLAAAGRRSNVVPLGRAA